MLWEFRGPFYAPPDLPRMYAWKKEVRVCLNKSIDGRGAYFSREGRHELLEGGGGGRAL